jgi:hypothetical protein
VAGAANNPVTSPEVLPTVAIKGLLLLQNPPPTPSVNVVDVPKQILELPAITVGKGVTVTGMVAGQIVPVVYVIIAEPTAEPVTTPDGLTLAIPGALLTQIPPEVGSVKTADVPTHRSL